MTYGVVQLVLLSAQLRLLVAMGLLKSDYGLQNIALKYKFDKWG